MHKNLLWQAFLTVVLLVALGYSGIALYHYYAYARLTVHTTSITSMQWQIQEKADDEYILKTDYVFNVGEQAFQGSTLWPREPYRNRYAAEQIIKARSGEHWQVWYDEKDPRHSSLEKHFPLKECLSAIFLWGLLFYFVWLGYYVAKFKN